MTRLGLLLVFMFSISSAVFAQQRTEGCVKGDCQNGTGKYIFPNGDSYVGQFKNGKRNGKGTYSSVRGHVYNGQYINDRRTGYGTYTWPNGDSYIGEYKFDKRNGVGTYTTASGQQRSGIFENGDYLGPVPVSTEKTQVKSNPYIDDKKREVAKVVPKPEMEWISPPNVRDEVHQASYTLRACIQSSSELKKIQVYVNNDLQVASRGFQVKKAPTCSNLVERTVDLQPGLNQILITARNEGGSMMSEVREVNYLPKDLQSNSYEVADESHLSELAKKRTALIIGNTSYTDSPLKNAVNDATAMAAVLETLGFEVTLYTDINQSDMKKAIRNYGKQLQRKGGTGLFYFAGHGIQSAGRNYLIPVAADIEKAGDLEFEALDMGRLLVELEYAKNDMNIVILDACRDNPYKEDTFKDDGSGRGLAPVAMAPSGSFIAFATAPGSIASDGEGEYGLYTQELLKAVQKEGVKLEDVFKSVRSNVRKKSKGQQIPWESSSLEKDFYFKR